VWGAERAGEAYAKSAGVSSIDELRRIAPDKLPNGQGSGTGWPIVDGWLIPDDQYKLYEAGKISYMRTDSVNLSQDALDMAKNAFVKNYGDKYLEIRQYKNKIASAQEAHEAIRPTDFNLTEGSADFFANMLEKVLAEGW